MSGKIEAIRASEVDAVEIRQGAQLLASALYGEPAETGILIGYDDAGLAIVGSIDDLAELSGKLRRIVKKMQDERRLADRSVVQWWHTEQLRSA